MFDDGLADLLVAQRVRHVGVSEIKRPGARFRIKEGGFLTADGGEEPAASGVVADVELHGVTVPRFSARSSRRTPALRAGVICFGLQGLLDLGHGIHGDDHHDQEAHAGKEGNGGAARPARRCE